jgi:hypothetical protein
VRSKSSIPRWVAMVASVFVFVACQTAPKPDAPAPVAIQGPAFQPASVVAAISHADGPRANLFAAESRAVWVTSEALAAKRQQAEAAGQPVDPLQAVAAEAIEREFIVFECHLESVFGDPSIAYDAVGLRGISVSLEAPGGQAVMPAQKLIGTVLAEEDQGTLKRFSRTMVVVFPKSDVWLQGPTIPLDAAAARLVLQGHGSSFHFEWPAAPPDAAAVIAASEAKTATRLSFNSLYRLIAPLGTIFRD